MSILDKEITEDECSELQEITTGVYNQGLVHGLFIGVIISTVTVLLLKVF